MVNEKIRIKSENGQVLEVVVLSKNANRIEVVLGEGIHSMRCALTPTRNEMAYVGQIMGREIVYERSKAQVQADIDRLDPRLKKSR
jgi:K+/H+ antiporter YhaU regulatory subunit KhtT